MEGLSTIDAIPKPPKVGSEYRVVGYVHWTDPESYMCASEDISRDCIPITTVFPLEERCYDRVFRATVSLHVGVSRVRGPNGWRDAPFFGVFAVDAVK